MSQLHVVRRSNREGELPILGCIRIPFQVGEGHIFYLDLLVVKERGQALFGRDWLSKIKLNLDINQALI